MTVEGIGIARAQAVERFEVLNRPPRLELQAIVELAARVCATPMAAVNLLTDIEHHQVATFGMDAVVCRLEDSLCAAVLDDETPLVVADASLDPRFRDNPFVTGTAGRVRFYASHKLTTDDGVVIGTLCVFDEVPRHFGDAEVDALSTLADRVVDVLELSLRSRQLAESNQRLSSFAGRVSHDLKTPLTSVAMSLEMLRDGLGDWVRNGDPEAAAPEDMAWLLDRAIQGSERMAAMIDEVLTFASHGAAVTGEPVGLDELLPEVLADLGGRLDGVTVERGPLPVVAGDSVQLRSLLQNLLDNAAKYRRPDRPASVSITARQRGECWRVAVADNGPGIPVADRERVFEARVRLANAAEGEVGGSGIGLDTCQRVVHAHGGTIGIEDTPGGGTTVWFELPAG